MLSSSLGFCNRFTRKCDDALEPIWLDFEVETHDIVMRVPIQR